MLSSFGGEQPPLLPQAEQHGDRGLAEAKMAVAASAPGSARSRDKTRCLDGLRGIACLIVFNYHFLWPWTPSVMLGFGAMPPGAPEPYTALSSLPIVCLLTRGRPMVAIFFAISGYVICRRILRLIHERQLDAAYQSISTAVFTRTFRLYLPPFFSMFLVAMLAQMGVFRSIEDIYTGPDSIYINGTVTHAHMRHHCLNGTFAVSGATEIAETLGLQNMEFLNSTINSTDVVCLNITSKLFGPSSLYDVESLFKASDAEIELANGTMTQTELTPNTYLDKHLDQAIWIQYGGSWEEHPFIHDNMTYALQNFTRAYAEWANPFNFGHYHPRYDPHTFTIPMELRGSMFIYIFLLGTAAMKAKWRLPFAAVLSAYSLTFGRWDMATFLGGTIMSEMDIRSSSGPGHLSHSSAGFQRSTRGETAMRWCAIFVALFLLSYPDAGAEYTPGFIFLSDWVPKYYIPLSGWMFYQPMGALTLVHCILRSRVLRSFLEAPTAQYLGKISFSLYLVHGPVLHSLGFWIMPRLFERFGQPASFMIGWVLLLSVTLYLAGWWHRKVDVWSTTVGRRIHRFLVD